MKWLEYEEQRQEKIKKAQKVLNCLEKNEISPLKLNKKGIDLLFEGINHDDIYLYHAKYYYTKEDCIIMGYDSVYSDIVERYCELNNLLFFLEEDYIFDSDNMIVFDYKDCILCDGYYYTPAIYKDEGINDDFLDLFMNNSDVCLPNYISPLDFTDEWENYEKRFDCGLYEGQNLHPSEVLKEWNGKGYDVIFYIKDSNPFNVTYSFIYRERL